MLFVADITNSRREKGVAFKFTSEKNKEYSAEILARLLEQKMINYKKVDYRLEIKTPTKHLINAQSSIYGKPGSNFRVTIQEDKLFSTPIRVTGKWISVNMKTPPTHTYLNIKKLRSRYLLILSLLALDFFCFDIWQLAYTCICIQ